MVKRLGSGDGRLPVLDLPIASLDDVRDAVRGEIAAGGENCVGAQLRLMIHRMDRPVAEGDVFFVVALETELTGLDIYSAPLGTEREALLLQAEWGQVVGELTHAKLDPGNDKGVALVGSAEEWRLALKSEEFRAWLKS